MAKYNIHVVLVPRPFLNFSLALTFFIERLPSLYQTSFLAILHLEYVPGHEKMCLMSYANVKSADPPAHSRSLISAFVVRCLDSIISLDSIAEISRL